MEIGKVNVANVQTPKTSAPKQDYSYLWDADQDIIDENVKYAAEQNKKKYAAELATAQEKLGDAKTPVEVFNRMGISTEADKDGKLTISHYQQPSMHVSFKDLGVDENELMANVKEITGNANFSKTSLTNIDTLEKVGGKADISFTKVKSMKNLKEVGSIAQFNNSLIEELPNLKSVGAMANLSNTKVKELPALETVNGNLDLEGSPISKMPSLKKVKGDVNLVETNMKKEDVTAEVGGKVRDKREPFVPDTTDYSYLWDPSDRIAHNKNNY